MGGAPITELVAWIEHNDPAFRYKVKGVADGHHFEEEIAFTTDDKPSQESQGGTVKAHWEDSVLLISVTPPDGGAAEISRLSLSPDGKVCYHDYSPDGSEPASPSRSL